MMMKKKGKKGIENHFKVGIIFIFLFSNILICNYLVSASSYGPKIINEQYTLSRSKVERVIYVRDVFIDTIDVLSTGSRNLEVKFSVSEDISDIIEFETSGVIAEPNNLTVSNFYVKGKQIGNYSGFIQLSGDIVEKIPVNITVLESSNNPPIVLSTELLKKRYTIGKQISFRININKLRGDPMKNITLNYYIIDENNKSYLLSKEKRHIVSSYQEIKDFDHPPQISEGYYVLKVDLEFGDRVVSASANFILGRSFLNTLVFGVIPMWIIILVLVLLIVGFLAYYFIKKSIASKQKYQMKLDLKTIPKKDPDFLFLGKIAEKKTPAYLDPYRLTTHCIVAGATGGGKSISAQVIIEEALIHNVAVIVMDPTAQWSGMLRKCTDKKMMSYYPLFGLKPTDARGFKGNVRQIQNSREIVEIKKYMTPGQINIFSLNKLDPKEMDFFVANFIRQIFKSDPKEAPNLKMLLVFDEVHRLLSKFGGSGEGFLQVERCCREFRKWGLGVMLISQVLSDFVGEIKANISTEVQMRTRDENDLNRIKTKYGEEFLRSLVKASVGVGMFVNPAYNHAQPYFLNFRPILHNTRRLSDEELDKYNKYNNSVDDLEYQVDQLETLKVDVFDLKMELKLIKDKIMSGSFSVVDIYLEGLGPRVTREWEKLGKKPKKREIKLVSEEEVMKSIKEAKKAREKYEKEEAKKKAKENPAKEETVKESIETKEVMPLTFDNGVMVSSFNELKGVLPNMDLGIFKTHVNEKKNDISDWILKHISEEFGKKLKSVTSKSEMLKMFNEFGKKKPAESKDVKSDENKGDEKKPVEDKKTLEEDKSGEKNSDNDKKVELKKDENENISKKGEEDSNEKKENIKDNKIVGDNKTLENKKSENLNGDLKK